MELLLIGRQTFCDEEFFDIRPANIFLSRQPPFKE